MQKSFSRQLDPPIYRMLLEKLPEAVVLFDENQVIHYWNPKAESIFGVKSTAAIGQPVFSLLAPASDCVASSAKSDDDAEQASGVALFHPSQRRRHNGGETEIFVGSHTASLMVGGQEWTAAFFLDVTAERDRTRRLARAAATDPLSGLLNRRGFQDQLEQYLEDKLTLAIVDADNFKKINDTYGHAAGDRGIEFVSRVLRGCFPDALCLARLGGDEFGVVTKTVSGPETTAAFETFCSQVSVGGTSDLKTRLDLSVSVGIAISNVSGTSARELLTTADRALYAAKEAGRNQIMSSVINV
jgi:diguanylate cyclase (GGDEF)-like protein/PAS domain S-box-containing protein